MTRQNEPTEPIPSEPTESIPGRTPRGRGLNAISPFPPAATRLGDLDDQVDL
jgi:hypothetical protein